MSSAELEAMHTTGSSCSAASVSHSVAETLRRQSGEGISGAVMPSIPPNNFTKNIFAFSLRFILDTNEGGQFEQA